MKSPALVLTRTFTSSLALEGVVMTGWDVFLIDESLAPAVAPAAAPSLPQEAAQNAIAASERVLKMRSIE